MNRYSRLLLTASLLVLPATAWAGFPVLWTQHFNGAINGPDRAVALRVLSGGPVFAVGTIMASDSTSRILALRYSNTGALLWPYTYTGPGIADVPVAIGEGPSGTTYVAGTSFDPDSTSRALLIKLNAGGVASWIYRDTAPIGSDFVRAMATDSIGNVFLATMHDRRPDLWKDSLLVDHRFVTKRISAAGAVQWSQEYLPGRFGPCALLRPNASTVVLVGSERGDSTGGLGYQRDFVLVAYEATAGTPLWTLAVDSPGSGDDLAGAAAVSTSGEIVVVGVSRAGGNMAPSSLFACGVSAAGSLQWTSTQPFTGALYTPTLGMLGNNAIVSISESDSTGTVQIRTLRLGATGAPSWVRTYDQPGTGGTLVPYSTVVAPTGSIYVAGIGRSASSGSFDGLVLKYSANGSLLGTHLLDRTGSWDELCCAYPGPSGSLYVAGKTYTSATSFDLSVLDLDPTLVSVEGDQAASAAPWFSLRSAIHDSANRSITFSVSLAVPARVNVELYDVQGRLVAGVRTVRAALGTQDVAVPTPRLASGIYFYRLQARSVDGVRGAREITGRLTVLK